MAKGDLRSRGSRREQILDSALALFVADGLNNVSTRRIAHAAGISQPSLYAHFATRDAIAVELCCRAFETLHDLLEKAGRSTTDPLEKVHRIGRTYIDFGLQNEAAYRVAFMLEMPAEHVDENSRVLDAGVRAFDVLHRAIASLFPDPVQASLTAQSAWAALHGLVSLLLARPEFPFADHALLVDAHLTHLMGWLADRSPMQKRTKDL
jgi:AcrR family transcriptional regulator